MGSEVKLDREKMLSIIQGGVTDTELPESDQVLDEMMTDEESSSKEDASAAAVSDSPASLPAQPVLQPEDKTSRLLEKMIERQEALAAEVQMMRHRPQPNPYQESQYNYQPAQPSGVYQQDDPRIVDTRQLAQVEQRTTSRLVAVEQRFLDEDFARAEAKFLERHPDADQLVTREWRNDLRDRAKRAVADGHQVTGSWDDVFQKQYDLHDAPRKRSEIDTLRAEIDALKNQQTELSKLRGVPAGASTYQKPSTPAREPGEKGLDGIGKRAANFLKNLRT